jgi:hypothetical protein
MSATLDKIIEEAKELSPEELKQLRMTVDSMLAQTAEPLMSENEFAQHLATKGIITLPEHPADDADEEWEPIEVKGQPLSEMIIEERR